MSRASRWRRAVAPCTFGSSDGTLDPGSALAFIQALRHGTCVPVNGCGFDRQQVHEERSTCVFEESG